MQWPAGIRGCSWGPVEELTDPTCFPRDPSLMEQPDTLGRQRPEWVGQSAPLLKKAGSFGLLTKQRVVEEGEAHLGWGLVPAGPRP